MRFVNLTDKTLRFSAHGAAYEVPSCAECEIPDDFAYVVKAYGLPLTPASDVTPAEASAPEPVAALESAPEPEKAEGPAPEPAPAPVVDDSRRGRRGR
jgi:hypothetical protein